MQAATDAAQQFLHLAAGDLVERAERLVEQQYFRLTREAAGQRGALRHAARQLRRMASSRIAEADLADRRIDTRLPLVGGQLWLVLEIETEGDVLLQRQPRQQARILKHHREARVRAGQQFAMHAHRARLGVLQAGQHAQQRRLADAARPEQRDDLTRRDTQREIAQHHAAAAVGLAIGERDRFRLQHEWMGHAAFLRLCPVQ